MTRDPGAHLDAERVGDLVEGLLPDDEARVATRHVARCPDCGRLRADYEALPRLLTDLPPVGPMPPDVAARLDAALAAAADDAASLAADRDTTARDTTAPDSRPGHVVALAERHRRWRLPGRLLPAAAAAVVVAALAAVAVGTLRGSPPATETSRAASAGASAAPEAGTGIDRAEVAVTASGHTYTRQTLAADVTRLTSGARPQPPRRAEDAPPGHPETAQQAPPQRSAATVPDPAAVRACTSGLAAGARLTPVAVDAGFYAGKPALVVVFADPAQPQRYQVFVVERSCRPGAERLLEFASVPRR